MKITVISFDNWGLNKQIVEKLQANQHDVNHIDFHSFIYKYPNVLYKIYNFFLKLLFNKNLKNIYYGKEIINRLEQIDEKQDVILTIKGDFIDNYYLQELKKYTDNSIAFYNDSVARYPKIAQTIPFFDTVYSFEKKDCKKYNMKFAPNWMYTDNQINKDETIEYDVFNICSRDKRLVTLNAIAKNLKLNSVHYLFLVFSKPIKGMEENLEFINTKKTLQEIASYVNRSKSLLEINRKKQNGLTFRVFECMALEKKLLTTNEDIVNYDFYNPNNIVVIDEKNPILPVDFFSTPYQKIPEAIYSKYTLDNWISNVIFSQNTIDSTL